MCVRRSPPTQRWQNEVLLSFWARLHHRSAPGHLAWYPDFLQEPTIYWCVSLSLKQVSETETAFFSIKWLSASQFCGQVLLPLHFRTRSSTPWFAPQQPRAVWRWSVPATHPHPSSTCAVPNSAKCCPAAQTFWGAWRFPLACALYWLHSWAGSSPSAAALKTLGFKQTCLRTSQRRWACLRVPVPALSQARYQPLVPAPPRAPAPVHSLMPARTSAPVRRHPAHANAPQLLPAVTMTAAAPSQKTTNAKEAVGYDYEVKSYL